MSTRKQRIRVRALKEIYIANSGTTAKRDSECDTWANDNNISEAVLGNWCPKLKADIKA